MTKGRKIIYSNTIKPKDFIRKQTIEDTKKAEANTVVRVERATTFAGCGAFCVVHDSSRGKSFISMPD